MTSPTVASVFTCGSLMFSPWATNEGSEWTTHAPPGRPLPCGWATRHRAVRACGACPR